MNDGLVILKNKVAFIVEAIGNNRSGLSADAVCGMQSILSEISDSLSAQVILSEERRDL